MIDSRTRIGKMIDKDKVVLECIKCGYKYISEMYIKLHKCPACKHEQTLVINGNYYVIK